jgi:hypothetical protein
MVPSLRHWQMLHASSAFTNFPAAMLLPRQVQEAGSVTSKDAESASDFASEKKTMSAGDLVSAEAAVSVERTLSGEEGVSA